MSDTAGQSPTGQSDRRTWKEKIAADTRRVQSNPAFITNLIDDRECRRSGHLPKQVGARLICDRCALIMDEDDES